ncbi:MAG: proline dehydrogenase family protein [Candidatus Bathyarchaeia archaeon]|nr:proline dehydrogenase [Candidatus Bathyarchaeota archaeon A05DMB-4]MDH7595151.1 proline dehydrogenase family protein [Candidatus Bathyarchaeota archaeon]
MSRAPVVSFFAYGVAKNWVAGKTVADALREAEVANAKGFGAILNYLGEEIRSPAEVRASVDEYKRLAGFLPKRGIRGCISIKPSQIGLNLGESVFRRNLAEIVEFADELGVFVWVDMEGSSFTEATLDVYCSLFSRWKGLGVCVQSYLKRSKSDVERLVGVGGKIRLVKGAYNEAASVAYKSKVEVDTNFARLMEYLFRNSRSLFSVSTHDDALVRLAVRLNKKYKRDFEFGFLKGIRDKLKLELMREGFRVTEYIPYGTNWLPYSIRRIREKPSNVLLLARSLINR